MRKERFIVVAAEDDRGLDSEVSHHFGRCPFYVLAETNGNAVIGSVVITNPFFGAHRPGVVPQFIRNIGANVIIAGGMGRPAIDMFHGFGIDVATGLTGDVETVLGSYLSGEHRGGIPCARDHSDSCGDHGQQAQGGGHE